MHQTVVTFEQLAELWSDMDIVATGDAGMFLSLTGRHPDLGAFVSIQDISPGIVLLSEHPFRPRCPVPDSGKPVGRHLEMAG